jgi:hypothetical protein
MDTSDESISQVLSILTDSYNLNIETVKEICLEYVDLYTYEIIMSDVFSSIPRELMEIILQRDTLFDGLDES